MLHLHNTLTRQKEPFVPLQDGHVGLYVCGITVYDVCHVGHGRVMIVYDVLYRHLQALGLSVKYVRNITDVDDKIIDRAAQNNESPEALSQRFIDEMHADERSLNVLAPTHEPRATETIDAMIQMITRLIDSGHAYPADNGDVFYSVTSFADYGKLSGCKVEQLRSGERVAIDEHKKDPVDFVLWKSSKPGEPSWESPWGPGRPGWHIECSAMSLNLLGEEFDIHGGGMDLEFPHHENEIAQSEALTGGRFARYWMHNGLVRIDDEKMSKSLNNFLTIRDVLQDYSGEEIRTFIVGSHYRSPLNYMKESLDTARAVLRRFYTALRGHTLSSEIVPGVVDVSDELIELSYVERFNANMNDDLNTPEALATLHDLAGALNKSTDKIRAQQLANTLKFLGLRLGILEQEADAALKASGKSVGAQGQYSDETIDELILERQTARANKDFKRSDEIRDQLDEQGIALEDTDGVTTWRRK